MKRTSIEDLEAELARQDELLARTSAAFADAAADGARFEVPTSFFEELEEACRPRVTVSTHLVFGLRA